MHNHSCASCRREEVELTEEVSPFDCWREVSVKRIGELSKPGLFNLENWSLNGMLSMER